MYCVSDVSQFTESVAYTVVEDVPHESPHELNDVEAPTTRELQYSDNEDEVVEL
jgi:hypothetical protein